MKRSRTTRNRHALPRAKRRSHGKPKMRTASWPAAKLKRTMKPMRYPVGFTIQTGSAPEYDKLVRGAKKPRGWHRKVMKVLGQAALRLKRKALLRLLEAPTASGKSFATCMLAIDDLVSGAAKKIIVAVPQSIIGSSFADFQFWIGNKKYWWSPGYRLLDIANTVERLREFLTTPLAVDAVNPERILICTHATLARYFARYHGAGLRPSVVNNWSDFKDVSLFIDEAHHVCTGEETVQDLRDMKECNRLGDLVAAWIERQPGPLMLTSATWFRSDRYAILSSEQMKKFTRFQLSAADFLKSLRYLREIEIRFLLGTALDCVKHVHDENPTAKTLVYLHPSQREQKKDAQLDTLVDHLGLQDWWDLVNVAGRDERKAELIQISKLDPAGVLRLRTKPADWIFAFMLGREGFDYPALERSIVIGARESLQVMMQMLGRLMRDYPGKTKVQFNVVLPFLDSDMTDGALIRDYMKIMLAALAIGVVLQPPTFKSKRDKETAEKQSVQQTVDNLNAVAQNIGDDPIDDSTAMVKRMQTEGKLHLGDDVDPDDAAAQSQRRVLLTYIRHIQDKFLDTIPDPHIAVDDFTGLRMWRLAFGHKTLTELNRSVGAPVEFAPEYVERVLRDWAKAHPAAGIK